MKLGKKKKCIQSITTNSRFQLLRVGNSIFLKSSPHPATPKPRDQDLTIQRSPGQIRHFSSWPLDFAVGKVFVISYLNTGKMQLTRLPSLVVDLVSFFTGKRRGCNEPFTRPRNSDLGFHEVVWRALSTTIGKIPTNSAELWIHCHWLIDRRR